MFETHSDNVGYSKFNCFKCAPIQFHHTYSHIYAMLSLQDIYIHVIDQIDQIYKYYKPQLYNPKLFHDIFRLTAGFNETWIMLVVWRHVLMVMIGAVSTGISTDNVPWITYPF